MTLAVVLAFSFLSGGFHNSPAGWAASQTQDQSSAQGASTQAPAPPGNSPAASSPKPSDQPQAAPTAVPAKPSATHARRKKKTTPDCTSSASSAPQSAQPAPPDGTSTAKPCPPPKVVVKNGGSDEPTIELKGNTTPAQASQQRSTTEQLTEATEGNLKKISGLELNPSQQEMVTQVKQFLDQSKKALAEGDLQRGHALAMKAELLSDELVKPQE
jgi:hypothetical protein